MSLGTSQRTSVFLGVALLAAVLAAPAQPPAAGPGAAYDVSPRRLAQIPPGTVIGREPPRGWSHLIIKSHPRVGAGDVQQVNNLVVQLSSFLFTSIVANVQADQVNGQARYRLTGLAAGLGTALNGQDTIITPDSQQKLGANLGVVARIVLATAQDKMAGVLLAARSNTFGIIDGPAVMLQQGKHRPVTLRYALLVDPATGRLETLLWLRDSQTQTIEWLPPNKLEDCILHVDAGEFVLGQPTENAFAMVALPRGQRQLAMPPELRGVADQPKLTAAQAHLLEVKLRQLLTTAPR